MKLAYRGVSYETQPLTLEVTEGEIGGMYRGQTWKVHKHQSLNRGQVPLQLSYRGIPYKPR
ncbi:MAG TPA: hypothetical protein DCY91_02645 [Cyanobacteria bacterium UBA11370]|nr:hypothetical protein [Cyanobacteria bacterium UBA11370]HBY79904.1 hypothetical protein [Cyanobacteria bacterium UBA11148]